MYGRFLVFVMFVLISSCVNKQKEDGENCAEVIAVNPRLNSTIKLSTIVKNLKVIPLQTSDSIILNEILNIKKVGSNFFLKTSGALKVFNDNGCFLRDIGTIGKGPEEILSVTNFYLDESTKTIEIYDGVRSQNVVYDFEGNVLEVEKHKHKHGYDFIKSKSGGYFYYLGFEAHHKGELIYVPSLKHSDFKDILPFDKRLVNHIHFGDLVNFVSNKYGDYFLRSFNNNVYRLNDTDISVRYKIDFGKYSLPDELLYGKYSDVRDFMMTCSETDYSFRIIGFYELENWIIFGFHWKKKIWNAVYDKKSKKCFVVSQYFDDYFNTQLQFKSSFNLLPKGFSDDEIYVCIDAYQIKEVMSKLKKINGSDLKKLFKNVQLDKLCQLKAGDNPVIIQIKMK